MYAPIDGAAWKTALGSILDRLHERIPAASIHVSYPWGRATVVSAATIHGYIDEVLTPRSAYADGADDEAVWLEGGDDGATMTNGDGVHYSAAGCAEKPVRLRAAGVP